MRAMPICALACLALALPAHALPPNIIPFMGFNPPGYTITIVAGTSGVSTGYGSGFGTLVSSTIHSPYYLNVVQVIPSAGRLSLQICGFGIAPSGSSLTNFSVPGLGFSAAGSAAVSATFSGGCELWQWTFGTAFTSGTTYTATLKTDGTW